MSNPGQTESNFMAELDDSPIALETQAKEKPTKPDAQEGFLHKLTKEEVKNCAENPDYEEEP